MQHIYMENCGKGFFTSSPVVGDFHRQHFRVAINSYEGVTNLSKRLQVLKDVGICLGAHEGPQ